MALRIEAAVGASIRIDGTCAADGGPGDPDRFEFSKRILSVVADEHGIEKEGGIVRCWLKRRLQEQEFEPPPSGET